MAIFSIDKYAQNIEGYNQLTESEQRICKNISCTLLNRVVKSNNIQHSQIPNETQNKIFAIIIRQSASWKLFEDQFHKYSLSQNYIERTIASQWLDEIAKVRVLHNKLQLNENEAWLKQDIKSKKQELAGLISHHFEYLKKVEPINNQEVSSHFSNLISSIMAVWLKLWVCTDWPEVGMDNDNFHVRVMKPKQTTNIRDFVNLATKAIFQLNVIEAEQVEFPIEIKPGCESVVISFPKKMGVQESAFAPASPYKIENSGSRIVITPYYSPEENFNEDGATSNQERLASIMKVALNIVNLVLKNDNQVTFSYSK